MAEVDLSGVEAGGFEPMPSGVYHLLLTDYEERETSETSKHPENPYYNVEFIVQSGPFEGRKLWTNVMLPPYQPFILKQLVQAAGEDANSSIDPEAWLDEHCGEQEYNARVKFVKASGEYDARNEIKGFKPYDPSSLKDGGESKASAGFAP